MSLSVAVVAVEAVLLAQLLSLFLRQYHWYDSAPSAATVNSAVSFSNLVTFSGWEVISGLPITVNVTALV